MQSLASDARGSSLNAVLAGSGTLCVKVLERSWFPLLTAACLLRCCGLDRGIVDIVWSELIRKSFAVLTYIYIVH